MFPRSKQLTFKDELYTNIARSASQFGEVYNFVSPLNFLNWYIQIPEAFVVPRDRLKMEAAFRRNNETAARPVQYIVKPVHSSEGKGIFFITKAIVVFFLNLCIARGTPG